MLPMEPVQPTWPWFAAWALVGMLFGLGVTSLGIFAVPVGIVFALLLLRRHRDASGWGFLAGLGVLVSVVGAINLDYQPCPPGPVKGVIPPGGSSVSGSCGGVDGLPWLIVGLVILAVAVAAYVVAHNRQAHPH
jgi:hypothetical protein